MDDSFSVRRRRSRRMVRLPDSRGQGEDGLQGRAVQGLLPRPESPSHVSADVDGPRLRGRSLKQSKLIFFSNRNFQKKSNLFLVMEVSYIVLPFSSSLLKLFLMFYSVEKKFSYDQCKSHILLSNLNHSV